jgi:primosomal protein N' (replication factor Y)
VSGSPSTFDVVQVAVPVPLDRVFSYRVAAGSHSPAVGCRVIVPFGARTVTGVVVAAGDAPEAVGELKEISRVLDEEPLFDGEYLSLARWLSATYVSPLGEVLSAMLPGARRTRELPELSGDEPTAAPAKIVLSDEQERALTAITVDGQPGDELWFYLYGITGSGKTEVFLRAAEAAIARGTSVIYLVPEIALTHQLFDHIRRRFGPIAAMLHSGMTPSQRLGEWRRIQRGEARLVVGARSAVFAPVYRLGLVVIDEEHENSYKAGNAPRYHARQVALRRAVQAGAVCVMGSATPSVEAWHLMEEGRLKRLDLSRRLSGGALPRISVHNVRGTAGVLSEPLVKALRETHAAGAQSILFLNRRGFASVFLCRSCGYQMECPHCSVPMTWHKSRGRLVCHWCGHHAQPLSVCPECGSLDVGYTGFGTERIEEDVQRMLPELRVARLDTDVTARRGALRETLDQFSAGLIDVLLGTQMVAKGLNFPNVRTVGIVMADTGLSLPDFRAAERTFSLIVQVAGRAGRFRTDGEVIVQTLRPEHPAIRRATRMEVDDFYREELAIRRELLFPPFARLLRVVVRSSRPGDVESSAQKVGRAIRDRAAAAIAEGAVEVMGPAPPPLERINRNWRRQILLRGPSASGLAQVIRGALLEVSLPRGSYVEVDVDPVNLL